MSKIQEELARLDGEIQTLNHKQRKLNQLYDLAPDGSAAKRQALRDMKELGKELRAKWARVNELI